MTKAELLKELSQTLTKSKVNKLSALANKVYNEFTELIELTFYPKTEIAFRAAWVLENFYLANRNNFKTYLPDFISAYLKQENLSCKRHFTKIMMDITSKENNNSSWPNNKVLEEVIATTFEWLISTKTPVAVKVNCLDILYNLSDRFDWIKEELTAQIEFLLKDGSAAMQSRGKKILKKLNYSI